MNEAETIRETLFGDDAEGGGASENGDDDDSDNEEDDEEEEEDDGEEEEWTPAISRKKWVQDIHRAQTEWDEWKPTDPTERLLKKTVEDVYNKLRN